MKLDVLSFLKRKPIATGDYSFETKCLSMTKDPETGDYFLMTVFSNKYRDIDAFAAPHKGGEIVSDKAHRAYIAFLDQNPDLAPELWSFHTPGTERKNRAHWWAYDDAFIYAEFRLTPDEAFGVSEFSKKYTPGLSHGFYVFDYDEKEAVINDYYTFEISILPLEAAANPWTTFELLRKENEMGKFDAKRREALVALHGESYVANLETKGPEMMAYLEELGVESKKLKEGEAEVEAEAETPVVPAVGIGITEEQLIAALEGVVNSINADLQTLIARQDAVEKRLETVESEDVDRIAAKAAAYTSGQLLASWKPKSAVGAAGNLVDDADPLKKAKPAQSRANGNHQLAGLFGGN